MKLIYQQMIGFFVVIFTTLLIVSAAVINYNNRSAYETTWRQLEGYAQNFGKIFTHENEDTGSYTPISTDFLNQVRLVLSNDQVVYAVINDQNEQIYPRVASNSNKATLQNKIWKQLKKGQVVRAESSRNQGQAGLALDNDAELTYVIYPWFDQHDNFVGAMFIASRVTRIRSSLREMEKNLLVALLISLLIALGISFLIAHFYVRRINRLRSATRAVAHGHFDVVLHSNGRDEIDDLVDDFDTMVQSLDASEREIARQEQRRKEFMANAAHEMRTPLTTINGLLEGLAYGAIPEESKDKSIKLMQNETKRLIRLVNENLDYEKIRNNQIILNKRTFDGTEALNNIVSQLSKKAAQAQDELLLLTNQTVYVYADYDRFIQIIFNITQNAIQFTQKGRITLAIHEEPTGVKMTVADNGIGMSDDQLKNIWERYYKADPSRKNTKYGESGLGLAIVHSLVEQHHGKIEVESELHKGTTFTIFLPNEANATGLKPKKK